MQNTQTPTTNDDAWQREKNNGSMQIESTDNNKGTMDRPREGRESEKDGEEKKCLFFIFEIIKKRTRIQPIRLPYSDHLTIRISISRSLITG